MSTSPIAIKGAEHLGAELSRLKSEERPRIIQAIAEARAHGDLKENAEYHAAKEQQAFCEGRISDLEGRIRLLLEELETEKKVTYQIVGDLEADISQNRISISSPVARALIGKEEGDEVIVKAPIGDKEYEIIAVHYA